MRFGELFDKTVGVFGARQEEFEKACHEQEDFDARHNALIRQILDRCKRERELGLAVPFAELGAAMHQAFNEFKQNLTPAGDKHVGF